MAANEISTCDKHYSFSDPVPTQQKLYYRLKQTDKEGAYSYSKIVTVQTEEAAVRIQPNPVQQMMRIQLPDSRQPQH